MLSQGESKFMKKVILLDVSAIMYRAFFANPHFRTKNEPTGAVYGFTGTLLKIIKELQPDYMAAAFDVSRKTLKRTELYSDYKAHREAAPEDLVAQIKRIEQMLDAFNIKRFKIDGHEADDVIGTVARRLSIQGYEVYVVTGDKDLMQIVDKNINIALLGKGDGKEHFKIIRTDEDVVEYLGVKPNQVPDLFGLIGDTSDGIPGVRKIGPKKAVPMIEKYGNLESIYENIDSIVELPGIGASLVQNMKEDKELAFISRQLATIENDIPEIDFEIDELQYGEKKELLVPLLEELEFKHLIKKYKEGLKDEDKDEGQMSEGRDPHTPLLPAAEKKPITRDNLVTVDCDLKKPTYIVKSRDDIEKLCDDLEREKKLVVFPSEIGFAISTKNNNYYIPLGHKQDLFGSQNATLSEVDVIFKKNYEVVTFNMKSLFKFGVSLDTRDILFDMLIANHLLTSTTKEDIEKFAHDYCNVSLLKFEDLFKKVVLQEINIDDYSKFMCERSRVIYETTPVILKRLQDEDLISVMKEIETPLIEVLYSMEKNGIKIDVDYFAKLSADFNSRLEDIKKDIFAISKKEFNINSPKQLGEVLFLDLGLPIIKKGKTAPSTDVDVLEELEAQGHDIAKLLLAHRHLAKLTQTYIEPLPKLVDSHHRLHSSFNQIGTTTGRLSSSNPNLQNIPVKSEEGLKIRQGFIVDNGNKMLGIDYSQIELRVLAEVSRDENLLSAYQNNLDLHELTARKIFHVEDGVPVTREQRTIAKTINFSVIYGKTPFGLAKELKISPKEAAHYISTYFEQYPAVKVLEHKIIQEAEQNGYVRTLFGRKRFIDDINSKNKNIKQQAERMAVNTVIQGTAAEIIKKAMINIYEFIKTRDDIKLILQVHDELIFEVKSDMASTYQHQIEKMMREAITFEYSKLEVNGSIGRNWSETK